jgi:hypothetical protein
MKVGVAVVPKRVRTALTKRGRHLLAGISRFWGLVYLVLLLLLEARRKEVFLAEVVRVGEDGSWLEVVVQQQNN